MSEELDMVMDETNSSMQKAINHLEAELTKIRAGKANPNMLDGITVDYYGAPTPISQVANVNLLDARTLAIQPWEKNVVPLIERAILQANIGITPQSDGVQIRLFMPPLTEERRRELVKRASNEGEQSKVAIRSIRRDSIEYIKKLEKDGLSKDEMKDAENAVQGITDKFIALVDTHFAAKEKEMMAI